MLDVAITAPVMTLGDRFIDEWEEFAIANRAPVFTRPGWVRAWAASFSTSTALVTAREHNDLRAVLVVQPKGRSLWSATNSETTLWQPLFNGEGTLPQLLERLKAGGCRHLSCSYLPELGGCLVDAANAVGMVATSRRLRDSPIVKLDGTWETYSDGLPTKLKGDLRRRWRRLGELGEVTYSIDDGSDGLEQLLEDGFGIEAEGWKGTFGTAVVNRSSTQKFYWDVAHWAAQSGILRLHFIRVDERPIAFAFAIADRQVLYGQKLSYSPEFRSLGPGILLLHRQLEAAFADSTLEVVHLGGENDGYKQTFANGVDGQARVDLWSSKLQGAADARVAQIRDHARAELNRRVTVEQRERWGSIAANPRAALERSLDWVRRKK
jgi:CelD/BcsL family acetyltransferase involved in cellulose biosynthesis